ncbi:immunoglobulin superfamily member 1-like [Rhineura floridana]|uniref:immunoglobulin superfamily member 1-like n=1 Tax=Rhineura floridana TaxID=261503 RepID=UPI002AC81A9A|nr:immunoglobulin superfamily member 1-like [Rhineura floridana]
MRFSFNILFLGCWLTRQWQMSRGQSYSQPSITVIPSPNITLGQDFLIYCENEHYYEATFELFKSEPPFHVQSKKASKTTEFYIYDAKEKDGGIYQCRYCFRAVCSEGSNRVYINIKGQVYPKPSISVSPSELVAPGENATIYCKSEGHRKAEFILQKETSLNTSEIKKTELGEILFSIVNAKPSDGGTYRCTYCFTSGFYQPCSHYSDRVYINITGFTHRSTIMWVSIAAGLLLVLFLLVLAFILCRRRRRGSTGSPANERIQPVSIPLELDTGEDPDGVSYAVLNHSSLKTKQAPDADRISKPCIYAELPKDRARHELLFQRPLYWLVSQMKGYRDQWVRSSRAAGTETQLWFLQLRYCATNGIISFPGLLLTGQWQTSTGTTYRKPSILVSPSNTVSLGENILLGCKSEYPSDASHYLHKVGDPRFHTSATKKVERGIVVFTIANARERDGGVYRCIYCMETHYELRCSDFSDVIVVKIRGQPYPKPSITASTTEMVAEEGNITCKTDSNLQVCFFLFNDVDSNRHLIMKKAKNEAVFAFAKEYQGGIYKCRYCTISDYSELCSDFSDSKRINKRDPSLSKPSIKVRPRAHNSPDLNITIECQGSENSLNFSLYKSNDLIASQMTEPQRNTTEFHLLKVGLDDEGNYTCQYHRRGNSFAWSQPSDPVKLLVRGMSGPTTAWIIIWTSIAAGLVLLLLLLLLFVLCGRRKREGSTTNEKPQPMNTAPELYGEVDPDGVSYAVLNHYSMKTKRAAAPDKIPETCVYATVTHNKTRESQ